jgi:hypothetical protein
MADGDVLMDRQPDASHPSLNPDENILAPKYLEHAQASL